MNFSYHFCAAFLRQVFNKIFKKDLWIDLTACNHIKKSLKRNFIR